ncbi:hypothetical protein AVEN_48159-1 [Araneus ventricosus]|uniref:Uncharacterized protein n=1 Tax=Araneus ventricosus TaxID=182803 RepID=A0A4Y2W231_ARAVE|nr:hypothetical protein AVEN_48159-1 [Araneus ventricosus]
MNDISEGLNTYPDLCAPWTANTEARTKSLAISRCVMTQCWKDHSTSAKKRDQVNLTLYMSKTMNQSKSRYDFPFSFVFGKYQMYSVIQMCFQLWETMNKVDMIFHLVSCSCHSDVL